MSNEFVLITEIFSAILHSKKAASSLIISNSVLYKTSPRSIWTGKLCQHTGYSLQHLSDTVKLLLELIRSKHNTDKATAMREKYVKNSPTDENEVVAERERFSTGETLTPGNASQCQ